MILWAVIGFVSAGIAAAFIFSDRSMNSLMGAWFTVVFGLTLLWLLLVFEWRGRRGLDSEKEKE